MREFLLFFLVSFCSYWLGFRQANGKWQNRIVAWVERIHTDGSDLALSYRASGAVEFTQSVLAGDPPQLVEAKK